MAINLNKNKSSLVQAWKDVIDDKNDINWALFGYEGQTNDLKVISQGSQGIEELTDDLSSGKIMYAFVKIDDPKTSLPKYILINWQGEGSNTLRKGICANHLRDVENFFTGAHLTVTARNEEEVELDLIIEKIAKSGSVYSFKTPRSDNSGPTDVIGSNYQRVNPIKEINSKERDQFWLKEEEEEKRRVAEERKRKEEERLKREKEAKEREILEAEEREVKTRLRDNQIEQIKEAEKLKEVSLKVEYVSNQTDEGENINQQDLMREERNREACELIAQRTINAKLIFEKNTSVSQIKLTPQKPARNSLIKAQIQHNVDSNEKIVGKINANDSITLQKHIEELVSDDENEQFSTIKRSPRDPEKKSEFIDSNLEIKNTCDTNAITKQGMEINKEKFSVEHFQNITDQQFVDEVIYQDFAEGPGLQARALYDYQAADDTEITFDPGDIISNIDQVDEGWWQGLGPDGTYGLFPANYVELIE